jgi:proline racemase
MARDHARGLVAIGERRAFFGPTGIAFEGEIIGRVENDPTGAVRVRVSGRSALCGRSIFVIERDDPLAHGFSLPRTFGDLGATTAKVSSGSRPAPAQ